MYMINLTASAVVITISASPLRIFLFDAYGMDIFDTTILIGAIKPLV